MKKVKGFTLLECLVALAILGIASMLLLQAYTQLMRVTRGNNNITASIGQQMSAAESGTDATLTAYQVRSDDFKVTLKSIGTKTPSTAFPERQPYCNKNENYSQNVTVYAVKAKSVTGADLNNDGSQGEMGQEGADVRYVYFH